MKSPKLESMFYYELFKIGVPKGINTDTKLSCVTGVTTRTLYNIRYHQGTASEKTLLKLAVGLRVPYEKMCDLYRVNYDVYLKN